ncbi:MAG: cation:proton antiporter [Coriobacteriales bacterium]|nr:cation:proton antiporter [Coriobacteriales bacterium]
MHTETGHMILSLLIIFAAGKFMGEVFERLRQPAVIGELLAGVIIGPGVLALVKPGEVAETVATMGVVVLMFAVGLETRPSELFKVGRTATIVATLGVIAPMALGFAAGSVMGFTRPEALFIGTALVATSVGITARVLADRGLITTRTARIVLAAAVIDDVLGMLVLSGVTGSVRGGVDVWHIGLIFLQAAVFLGFEVFIAPKIVNRHAHWLDKLHIPNAPLVVSIIVMLAMAALSEWIGLAGIVGAFFAGMMFAETSDRFELEARVKPLYEWLVPYFFVVTGMKVQPALFAKPAVLLPGLALVTLAVLTKVVGCGLGALGGGVREALAVGVGMVPRGEVGLIVASVGLSMGIVSPTVYAIVVLVVVVTTVIVPPVLPPLFMLAQGDAPVELGRRRSAKAEEAA